MRVQYDVLGIGNSIVDISASVDDGFLDDHKIIKSSMGLIDETQALSLHQSFRDHVKNGDGELILSSGGSCANSIAGIAKLGVKTAFIGKTKADRTGKYFNEDLKRLDIYTPPSLGQSGHASGRCLVAITPDGERSMSTFLGANVDFKAADIDKKTVQSSAVIFLEGYLFDTEAQKAGFVKACELAKAAGRKIALSLSDVFCIDRHRAAFLHLVDHYVDIVFANRAELLSLYQVDDLSDGLRLLWKTGTIACVTRSEKGSVILENGQVHEIKAVPVANLIDATGAGDQYAAGVLTARAMGMDWIDAGNFGSFCAAEVVSHYGARPHANIHDLMQSGVRSF